MLVELGRRVSLRGEGGVVEGGVVPLRLEPEPDRARKAEKKERGEGGEVDMDCCNRGRTGAVIGDEEVDPGGDVDIRGTDCEDEGASGVTIVSPLLVPFFFRSSSSRFRRSSSSVCKL